MLFRSGLFIIADYAAAKGTGFGAADSLHRSEADAVKAELAAAGFNFDGESRALALSADDHSKLADGTNAQRDKNDQFLLRFRKPANAPNTDHRPKGEDPLKNYYGNTIIHGVAAKEGVTVKDGRIIAGAMKGVTPEGARVRYSYFNADGTYEEFGRIDEGPGPMQSGVWFWDADGNNCELHQFPLDERGTVVCHTDDYPRPIGVVQDHNPDGSVDARRTEIVKGHVRIIE